MNTQKELVTIISESILEDDITEQLRKLGANGYTIFDARGQGQEGVVLGGRMESSNIQIQVVCTSEVADAIQAKCQSLYFDDFNMIIYRSTVNVIRSEKFE